MEGTTSYFDVAVGNAVNAQAAWTYPQPSDRAAPLVGDRVAVWRGVRTECDGPTGEAAGGRLHPCSPGGDDNAVSRSRSMLMGAVAGAVAHRRRPRWWRGLGLGVIAWSASYATLPLASVYKPIWEYDADTLSKGPQRESPLRRGGRRDIRRRPTCPARTDDEEGTVTDIRPARVDRDEVFLEYTKSICPVCKTVVDTEVNIRDNEVFLRKRCREHGSFRGVGLRRRGDVRSVAAVQQAGYAPAADPDRGP